MTPEQEQKLDEVYGFIQSLKNSATIPQPVDAAFRDRLSGLAGLAVSAKGANDEDQAVNEAGSFSYAVMGDPDGFLETEIGGTIYYLPFFA